MDDYENLCNFALKKNAVTCKYFSETYSKPYIIMQITRQLLLNECISAQQNGMIKVVTGLRRAGKSYLLFNLFYNYLLDTGVPADHIVRVNLEDRRRKALRDPDRLLAYIDSQLKEDGHYFVFIDEIQHVPEFEDVLNSYLEMENVDVYVTGSNARFLSKDVLTTFRGRGYEIRVTPLRFREYFPVRKEYVSEETALREYLLYGGLPRVATLEKETETKKYLTDLFRTTYLVDIKERNNLQSDNDLSELIDVVASSIGSLTNPLKLQNTFKTVKQSSISYNTIANYLEMLQDAFLIDNSVRYDIKGRRYINTPSKYYFTDCGLRNARINFRQQEFTHLMENMIYCELCARGYSVDVGNVEYNTEIEGKQVRQQLEVDFVCNRGEERIYIQSAYALPDEEKTQQELRSLRLIHDNFRKIVVVGGLIPSTVTSDGIQIVNVIDFLLKENI